MKYTCAYCGKEHEGLLMDPAYRRPLEYFRVPEEERKERVYDTDDIIAIDNKIIIVRGTLAIPVIDSDTDFVWGMWAKVDEQTGSDIWHMWELDGSDLPPYEGQLDTAPNGYEDIYNSKVSIQLQDKDTRPKFTLLDKDLLMYKEQQNGIELRRVHEILEVAMPWLFENA